MACAPCRTTLAGTWEPGTALGFGSRGGVSPVDTRLRIAGVRARLLSDLPQQGVIPRGSPGRRRRVLFASSPAAFWAWLAAVILVLAWAVALDLAGVPLGRGGAGGRTGQPAAVWLQVLAPLLPIIGVACSYGSRADPAQEVVGSTAAGGLRLLLYRCGAVLSTCIPLATVAGLVTGGIDGVAWLLPALALTMATLALGSVLSLGLGAVVSAAAWLAMTGGPLLAGRLPGYVTAAAMPAWVGALVIGALVTLSRSEHIRRPADRSSRAR